MNIRETIAVRRARRMIEWIEKNHSVKLEDWQREVIEKEYLAEAKQQEGRDRIQTEGAGMSARTYTVDENPGWKWVAVEQQEKADPLPCFQEAAQQGRNPWANSAAWLALNRCAEKRRSEEYGVFYPGTRPINSYYGGYSYAAQWEPHFVIPPRRNGE